MITKTQFTDLVIERLAGGPVTDYRKYHPEVVGRIVDVVINSIIGQDVVMNEEVGSDWVQSLTGIPLKWDTSNEQCYIEWEQEILLLGTKGIREISWPVTETGLGFIIMPLGSYQVFSDLEASDIKGTGYMAIVSGNRVYFPQIPRMYAKKKKKLTARVILAASAYDEEEVLPIPDARMAEALGMIDQLTSGMKMTRVKVSNDTNPNTI